MEENLRLVWDLIVKGYNHFDIDIALIIAGLTSVACAYLHYLARKRESDNIRATKIHKSDTEYKARALESNNLRKVELAKLKHSHLQQTPPSRNNSPP